MSRSLDWDGCFNVRDLGGVALESGGETRHGAFVRAGDLSGLTDDGWAALERRGVTRIVDLRWLDEGGGDAPRRAGIEVVHVSLLGELDGPWEDEIDPYLPDDVAGFRGDQYLGFLERFRSEFGRAFRALAAPTDGAVVFHCVGGKDRTGLVAALLLRLAGVSIEGAADDYALSGEPVRHAFAGWIESTEDEAVRARRVFRLGTPREAMARTLRELGDVESYLLGAGVTPGEIARLRERLAPA